MVTYAILNIESGNLRASFDSEREALSALAEIFESEPEAVNSVGLLIQEDDGTPVDGLYGQRLREALKDTVPA